MIYYSYIDRFERKIDSDNKKDIKEIFAVAGNPIGEVYEYQLVNDIKQLVPCGETDRQAIIDSYAESTDINNIIERFLNGDEAVVNVTRGTYGDFRNTPKTYAEMFQRMQDCENIFNSLPADIKEKFDNSVEKFWSNFGNDNFNEIFNSFVNPIEDIKEKESEVKDAE